MKLIPDIGINWDGNWELLELMLKACYDAEIDLVKFQAFGPEHWTHYPQWPNLKNASVTPQNIDKIDRLCDNYNLEWFCTPTNHESIDMLEPYVKLYKIRYLDQNNCPLIERIKFTKKPWIISCDNPGRFSQYANTLYCVPKYPPELSDIDFDRIKYYDGYSNHYPGMDILFKAVQMGAKILEIHITPSKDMKLADNPVSFDLDELQEIGANFK